LEEHRRRQADLERSGGEEDPGASAVEEPADLRRGFRLFLANRDEGEERERGSEAAESTRAAWMGTN